MNESYSPPAPRREDFGGSSGSLNPYTHGVQASAASHGGGLVAVEQQRAIAEVQARMIIARSNPRNPIQAVERILNECTRPTLASQAVYQFGRGGSSITGPSIKLAETMARHWGNIASGIKELSRSAGYSECVAYAWDLETGYYDERQFQVKHWRDTKSGGYLLTDERDIYELIANMGQRRKRAVLLTVIPGDVQDAAVEACETTLNASFDTSSEALRKMVAAFEPFGVTQAQIEKRCQCRLEAIRPAQGVMLRKIYASLMDEMSIPSDWFEDMAPADAGNAATRQAQKQTTAAEKKASAKSTQQGEQQQNKPPAPDAKPAEPSDAQRALAAALKRTEPKQDAPREEPPPPAGEHEYAASSQQALQQQPAVETADTVEYWVVDEHGEPDVASPYTALIEAVRAYCSAWTKSTNRRALEENNADLLQEAATSDARAAGMLSALADVPKHEPPAVNQLAAEQQPSTQQQVSDAGSTRLDPAQWLVAVPKNAEGRANLPGYVHALSLSLASVTSAAMLDAWEAIQAPTWSRMPNVTKAQITDAVSARRSVLGTSATHQQPVDKELRAAEVRLKEIAACSTVEEIEALANATKAQVTRWHQERRDLYDMVAGPAKARRDYLIAQRNQGLNQ